MKAVRDTWLVFQREMLLYIRQPVQIAFSLAYPVTYLLIFAPMLRRALAAQGVTTFADAYRIYVPGLLALTAALGGFTTGFTLLAEFHAGIIERSRVTPASRVSLVLGRALREVTVLLLQAVVITLLALAFGLRIGVPQLLVVCLLFGLLALATVLLSYGLTIWVRNSAALGPVMTAVSQPLMLLSGMLLPLSLAPLWMLTIARENPFYWATTGLRDLFTGHGTAIPVWASLVAMVALSALAMRWSLRMFARSLSRTSMARREPRATSTGHRSHAPQYRRPSRQRVGIGYREDKPAVSGRFRSTLRRVFTLPAPRARSRPADQGKATRHPASRLPPARRGQRARSWILLPNSVRPERDPPCLMGISDDRVQGGPESRTSLHTIIEIAGMARDLSWF